LSAAATPPAAVSAPLLDVLSDLECPGCTGCAWPGVVRYGPAACADCGHEVELLPGLIRLRGSAAAPEGISQRLMHAKPVVSIYERAWRPAITWAASGLSYRDEMAFLQTHLPTDPASRLVDWCCGTGLHGRVVAERLRTPRIIVGVDASAPMARTAAGRAVDEGRHNQVIVEADLHQMKSRRSFTGGFCFAALHLLHDQPRALSHMARSLAPGSPFLCFTLYRPTDGAGVGRRVGIRAETREHVEEMFAAAGLEVRDVQASGRALLLHSRRV